MKKEIIWAAGFIDGEGTITIKRYKRKGCKNGISYQVFMSCSQTVKSRKAIELLKKLFGGSLSVYHQKGQREDTIQWSIVARDALNCLRKIYPYLIVKKEQAKLAISYYDVVLKNFVNPGKKGLTKEKWQERNNIFNEMRKLNVKGRLRLQRLNEETA